MTIAETNKLWGELIVEELIRCGVRYFCLSPGSRSTPLTAAAARNPMATTCMHFDERGAAFHALGYTRGYGEPAALVCTSGTAAANYYPAIIEAANDHVPMVVLTADRPPELRHTGANQTIYQPGMYADYPQQEFDLPAPEPTLDPRIPVGIVDQLVHHAVHVPRGPVHLNCPFREPLLPPPNESEPSTPETLRDWHNSGRPLRAFSECLVTSEADIADIAALCTGISKGIVTLGHLRNADERNAALDLVDHLGWPCLPDITSGLRMAAHNNLVPHYDLVLTSESNAESLRPEIALHIGGRLVSKRLTEQFGHWAPTHVVVVNDWTTERFNPAGTATRQVCADPTAFCRGLSDSVKPSASSTYHAAWTAASDAVRQIVEEHLSNEQALTEPHAARLISQLLPENHALWIASSMPVRDLDMFAATGHGPVIIASNRGASGIDGTTASATGFAQGTKRPVTLLIGDLAFLHDLNSLALVARSELPITIVLLNNNGGRIFEHLPVAEHTDVFERCFATPHGLMSFEPAAQQFGIAYRRVTAREAFAEAYRSALTSSTSVVIEVVFEPEVSVSLRRTIRRRIQESLR